jgi:dTDP-4-amino-4,6-dideoxygalactose transaminase
MYDPHQVTKDFEAAIAKYCGAPYAVATTSCTMGILLACAYFKQKHHWWQHATITMPTRSYIGVPMSIKHAGFNVEFRDGVVKWSGEYNLFPLPVWDSARRTTSGMYRTGQMQVLSLHWSKVLGVQQGGVILLDDPEAVEWLRRARFDGRREGVPPDEDTFDMIGYHAYMSPEVAASALMRLSLLPKYNEDLPWDNYPDLSKLEIFK